MPKKVLQLGLSMLSFLSPVSTAIAHSPFIVIGRSVNYTYKPYRYSPYAFGIMPNKKFHNGIVSKTARYYPYDLSISH